MICSLVPMQSLLTNEENRQCLQHIVQRWLQPGRQGDCMREAPVLVQWQLKGPEIHSEIFKLLQGCRLSKQSPGISGTVPGIVSYLKSKFGSAERFFAVSSRTFRRNRRRRPCDPPSEPIHHTGSLLVPLYGFASDKISPKALGEKQTIAALSFPQL